MLVLGHEPVPAPEERRGFSPEPEEPGRGPLGPVVRWWRAKPLSFRRRVWTAVVALHYLVVVGWGTYYNVQVYLDASATRAELERQVRAVETLPAVLQQIAEEREAAVVLEEQVRELYAVVPERTDVPVVVGRLETLGRSSGGQVTWIDYAPSSWNGTEGEVRVTFRFVGDFASALRFVTALEGTVPTLSFRRFEAEPTVNPAEVHLFAETALAVVAQRPEGAPGWRGGAPAGVITRAGPAQVSPFLPPPELWSLARAAGLPSPHVMLTGLVQRGGTDMAVLSINGESRALRPGESASGVTLVRIERGAAVIRVGGLDARLSIGSETR